MYYKGLYQTLEKIMRKKTIQFNKDSIVEVILNNVCFSGMFRKVCSKFRFQSKVQTI